jgi:hypothetical protein
LLEVHVSVSEEDRVLSNDIEALRMANEGDFIKAAEKVVGCLL